MATTNPPPSKLAFSLVELSIVLVILGLLTGGILAGQSLVKAAELRGISNEYQRFHTAVRSFQDRYFALPGDMRNATAFWGAANTAGTNGQCAAPSTDAGTGTQTCNGDGNGLVTTDNSTITMYESFRFWQHLANAGLLEGSYNGLAGSGGTFHGVPGTNVPSSKYPQGGWMAMNLRNSAGDATYRFALDYGNYFIAGSLNLNSVYPLRLLTPEQSWNIDTKIDDGMPATGKVNIMWWTYCTTATSQTDMTGTYLFTTTSPSCAIIFRQAF